MSGLGPSIVDQSMLLEGQSIPDTDRSLERCRCDKCTVRGPCAGGDEVRVPFGSGSPMGARPDVPYCKSCLIAAKTDKCKPPTVWGQRKSVGIVPASPGCADHLWAIVPHSVSQAMIVPSCETVTIHLLS